MSDPLRELSSKSVLPFVACLFRQSEVLEQVLKVLESRWGTLLSQTPPIPFRYTSYYRAEMGSDLKRIYVAFRTLMNPERLPRLKQEMGFVEEEFSVEGKRRVNLDPGYLGLSKVVLASTKDAPHRISLGHSLFGEVTLLFERGSYSSLPWTYPDYREPATIRFFNQLREAYRLWLGRARGSVGRPAFEDPAIGLHPAPG